jgi:hypothetical protein
MLGLLLTLAGARAEDFTLIGLSEGKEPEKELSKRADKVPTLTSLGRLTLEGCLARGNEADPYLLTEKDSGKTVNVVGTGDLEHHLGRLVKARGARSADERYFHATAVEALAGSCTGNDSLSPSSDSWAANSRSDSIRGTGDSLGRKSDTSLLSFGAGH